MSKTVVNKVTKVVWDNGFKPDGVNIPSVTSADQGKVLAVDSNGKWVAASPSAPQSELPEYSAADEGKILKVDDQGSLEWADDDNTQYTAGDNVSIVNGEISAVDTTYTAGDNVAISADNEISSVNTIVFNAKYFRATDTFQYDADAIAPFLAEIAKNDKRPIVRVQDANYDIYDIYTLEHYEVYNKIATFTKTHPIIVSANQREIVSANIGLAVNNGVGTLKYTVEGVIDLPEGATAGQIPVSDGHNGWVAGNIPSELPSVTSTDEGKVLKVDSNGDWAVGTDEDTKYTAGNGITITGTSIAADAQLPSYSSTENGKVLSVDSNGDLEWATPSAQDAIIVNLRRDTSNNAISITDTTYTTEQQIQTLVTDGKEVILRVQEDSTEKFEFFTLGADKAMGSQIGFMIIWNSISVDNFSTGLTHFSRISLLMGTDFTYEDMGVNLGGSSYTAGDGIDISAQDVISSPEAVMAKESIAPDFAPMSFYPLATSIDDPSLTNGFVRLYNTKGADPDYVQSVFKNSGVVTGTVYACIVNSYTRYGTANPGYRILCIQPNAQGSYSGQVGVKDYNSAAGKAGYGTTLNLWQTYTSDGVNFAYGAVSESDAGYTHYEEVSYDLSNCVYESDTAALAAFAALYPNLPTDYAEGDQAWKDGKLKTYTNGAWVDSDPLVEQKELPSYSSADDGKVLSVNSTGNLEWATPAGGGGIMIPNPRNIIKQETSMTSTNTYYSATQDCYFYCKLTGTSGTSASSGLDYMIGLYPTGDSVHGSAILAEGRYIINTGSPIVSHGFYLKAGYTIQVSRTISSSGTYTVYGLI